MESGQALLRPTGEDVAQRHSNADKDRGEHPCRHDV
jgi:hypothetical protein